MAFFKHKSRSKRPKVLVPIDFSKIYVDLIKHKYLYCIALSLALIVAIIYAYSLPNYYSCTKKMAAEVSQNNLLSRYDVSVLGFKMEIDDNREAIYPKVYPVLMKDVTFKTSLLPIKVRRSTDGKEFSYYEYLVKEQNRPWWRSLIMQIVNKISGKKGLDTNIPIDPFRLNLPQSIIFDNLNNNIKCEVDKVTWAITVEITDQDPLVAAMLADSVTSKLQQSIYGYRTAKARNNYENQIKKYSFAKREYEKAKQDYVEFADANRDLLMEKARQHLNSLEEEMNLNYRSLEECAKEVINADMKIQERAPVFTTLQSSTVPLKTSGPNRFEIICTILSLAFYGITIWVLYKENDLKMFITTQ